MKDISIKKNTQNDTIRIEIRNNLNVNNIRDVYSEILKEIDTSNNIELSLSKLNSIDVCGIQLVTAIEKYCESANKNLSKNISLDETYKVFLKRTGFVTYAN